MHDNTTLFGITDDVLANNTAVDLPTHVEVDWISSKDSLLSEVANLDTLDLLFDIGCMEDDDMTSMKIIVNFAAWSVAIGFEDNGTTEPCYLSCHNL